MARETRLIQMTGAAQGREIPLSRAVTLGRSEEADFVVEHKDVSRKHLQLRPEAKGWVAVDVGSTNGTFLNGQEIAPGVPVCLTHGSRLQIGDAEFLFADERAAPTAPPVAAPVPLKPTFTIGRAPDCDLVLDSPTVSSTHCRINRMARGWVLEDAGSRNGTFLNGLKIQRPETLQHGDEIDLGLHRFEYHAGNPPFLEHVDQSGTVRLDVDNLTHTVWQDGEPLILLNEVSLVIPPREFVAIVGGSGAGKTTLLNAIAGLHRPSEGTVRLNGVGLHDHAELFRPVIGYVPQEDVVHRELRVDAALDYAAELRLPPETDVSEREKLIAEALAQLELSHRASAFVSTLSGGERKRVSVAMEMLSHPGLLFLDEPTSGLDPGLELKFLELVKGLAEQGRTIVMVTHSASIMVACDKLLFMARGGRVAFYGPPQEALTFFDVDHIAQAYVRVDEHEHSPEEWEQRYRDSSYYRDYVKMPLTLARPHVVGRTVLVAEKLGATGPRLQATGQFALLLRRYADVIRGDRQNLAMLLGQAPFMALILLCVFPANLYEPSRFNKPFMTANTSVTPASLLWMMMLFSLLGGVNNAAREISKESAIYQRERMVNLKPGPYLLSKVALLSALCLLQSVSLVGLLRLKIDFYINAGDYLVMTGLLVLMTLCGSLLGLILSCYAAATTTASDRTNIVAKADNRAITLLPMAVLLPLVFSGLIDFDNLSMVGKFMPSYWTYGALGHLTRLNDTMFRFLKPKEQFTITPASAALALCVLGAAYILLAYGFLARKR